MIRRPPRSTQSRSSAASDVYKRQAEGRPLQVGPAGADRPCGPLPVLAGRDPDLRRRDPRLRARGLVPRQPNERGTDLEPVRGTIGAVTLAGAMAKVAARAERAGADLRQPRLAALGTRRAREHAE